MSFPRSALFLALALAASLTGCATAPSHPPTREECGPFPDNYQKIATDYARKANDSINPKFNKDHILLQFPSPPQVPDEARFSKCRGWLLHVQRNYVEQSGGHVSMFPLPFSIIIYQGKVVWSSDEQYGYKQNR